MYLDGQDRTKLSVHDRAVPGSLDAGYAMAALLVAIGVMAVMLTVAMPVWRQTSQREKEQELIFRGQQYARAIGLFEKKYANTPPPTIDVLVQEHFLRKKYKDPITNADFVAIPAAQSSVNTNGAAPAGRGATGAAATPAPQTPTATPGATAGGGGVMGVTSASKERSLRIYNGATHYNEWRFVYAPPAATPGAGGGSGTGTPGQGGGRGGAGQGQGGAGQRGPNQGNPGRGPGGPGNPGGGPGNPGGRNFNPGGGTAGQPPATGPFGRGR